MGINKGAIIIARQITESEVWLSKPAWWFKVWVFILIHVNHKDNKEFKRGSNFFSREIIFSTCNLKNDNIKKESIDNVLRWMEKIKKIEKNKTTRGIIITVLNYNRYQNLDNYRNEDQNETGTRQERDRNETGTRQERDYKQQ